jgi:hypothetical protein
VITVMKTWKMGENDCEEKGTLLVSVTGFGDCAQISALQTNVSFLNRRNHRPNVGVIFSEFSSAACCPRLDCIKLFAQCTTFGADIVFHLQAQEKPC